VYSSLMAIAMIVIALRYDLAVLLPPDDETAVNVVAVALFAVVGMSGLFAAAAWFIRAHNATLPGAHGLAPYLWLLPIGACGVGVYQVLVCWGLRHRAYKAIAASKFSQVAAQALTQIAGGLLTHGGLAGLLIGDVCGRVSGSWRIARITLRNDLPSLRRINFGGIREAARRYRNYPLMMAPAGLINTAGLQAVPLLFTACYGPRLVGLYALVDRTLQAPMALIAQATSQVYMAQAAELGAGNPAGLRRLFAKVTGTSLLYGIGPLIFICAFSPALFAHVFGEQWRAAGSYARILAPAYYFCYAHQCVGMTLAMLERQAWQFGWDLLRLTAVVSVLVGCSMAHLGFGEQLFAFAVVSSLSFIANLALCYVAIGRPRLVR